MAAKNLIILLTLVLIASGCKASEEDSFYLKWEPDCDLSTADVRAQFTLTCISNANPRSDEEPEDWIEICQEMAAKAYCPMATFKVFFSCSGCKPSRKVKVSE